MLIQEKFSINPATTYCGHNFLKESDYTNKAFNSNMLKFYFVNNLKEINLIMEATGSNYVFKFNPEVFKLDRFDGMNFTSWKDKLFCLLTELGVNYS